MTSQNSQLSSATLTPLDEALALDAPVLEPVAAAEPTTTVADGPITPEERDAQSSGETVLQTDISTPPMSPDSGSETMDAAQETTDVETAVDSPVVPTSLGGSTTSSPAIPTSTTGQVLASDTTVDSGPLPPSTTPSTSAFPEMAAVGNANPTVSFNLTKPADWATQAPFLDLTKTMRTWIGHEQKYGYGGMSYSEMVQGGYVDEDGWVTEIPDGLHSVGTIWVWEDSDIEYRKGVYVLDYEGEGSIRLKNVKVLSQEDGRIVFENTTGGTFEMRIESTDPQNTGDYIRDVSIVHQDHIELFEAGAIFNPDWLEKVADAREFRFMDWMSTNSSNLSSWDNRAQYDDAIWRTVPIEVMVQLANEAGVDPWFNIPHLADDDFIRQLGEYVRDNLDPNLTARFEWSNEVWNTAFAQHHFAAEQAMDMWGISDSYQAALYYQGMRAAQSAVILKEVFAESPTAPTLVNVMGSRPGSGWTSEQTLLASPWLANDPTNYVAPHSVMDELAVTTYFGTTTMSSAVFRESLLAVIEDPNQDANAWLAAKLMDPGYSQSIPLIANGLIASETIAEKYGLGLVAYEGGQHVHHSAFITGLTNEQIQTLTQFMTQFVRSPEMGQLYQELWDVWASVSDGAFMQYGDVGAPTKFGSWSLWSDLDDTTARAEFLEDQMENAAPWWGAAANDAYLQGVNTVGTDGNDTINGTDQEDYVAGGKGNDVFTVGAGRDGINGGEGIDGLQLFGSSTDYSIVQDGDGYLISGPDGDKFIINLETLYFGDGLAVSVADFFAGNFVPPVQDGTQAPTTDETSAPADPGTSTATAVDGPTNPDILAAGTEESPATEPQEAAPEIALSGDLLEIETDTAVEIARDVDTTVRIETHAVNRWSALGQELGLGSADRKTAFVVYEAGATATIADGTGAEKEYASGYYTVQENIAGRGGEAISDSALATALAFGGVVIDPDAVVGTELGESFFGRGGGEHFIGNGGKDMFFSSRGNDTLDGGDGRDYIYAGRGDDVVIGGAGNDQLKGGKGADRFYFAEGDGRDHILDFSANDTLDLSSYGVAGQTIDDLASEDGAGRLVISNGTDQITFSGLTLDDLDWIAIS